MPARPSPQVAWSSQIVTMPSMGLRVLAHGCAGPYFARPRLRLPEASPSRIPDVRWLRSQVAVEGQSRSGMIGGAMLRPTLRLGAWRLRGRSHCAGRCSRVCPLAVATSEQLQCRHRGVGSAGRMPVAAFAGGARGGAFRAPRRAPPREEGRSVCVICARPLARTPFGAAVAFFHGLQEFLSARVVVTSAPGAGMHAAPPAGLLWRWPDARSPRS